MTNRAIHSRRRAATPQATHSTHHRPTPLVLAVHLALMGGTLMASGWSTVAHAQGTGTAASSAEAAPKRYDIPAGQLGTVLARFAGASGVLLAGASDLVQGRNSPGLSGTYTTDAAAIKALLAGTGLEAVRQANGSYALRQAAEPAPASPPRPTVEAVLPVVKVTAGATPGTAATAYRAETASVGALGDKSLKDTPYSMEVFTRDLMDNKQVTSLNDITKSDASITPVGNRFNGQFTNLTVRGVQLNMNAGKIDGLNFSFTGSELPLEHFESVEILKGVSGFLYGFGEPGGGANYISKRPTAEPKRSLTTQLTDSGTLLLHGDVGGRFGADGRFGYRVNLVNEEGDTYIDDGGRATAATRMSLTPQESG